MRVPDEASNGSVPPVAIVGAGLRFPGAADPASFHELTIAGRGMPRELAEAVPPYVLAASTAAAALADVPSGARPVPPDRIGVIVADTPEPGARHAGDWVRQRLARSGGATGDGMAALGPAGGAGQSPCSLRAVVAACEALNDGEFDLVVAGGVSTGAEHAFARHWAPADSRANGDVRVYDAAPTGTPPGEGCGAVALMRAADARADGLPAYAEIVGWCAADGGSLPVLLPAYLRAGVDPADVQLVEGHGAATEAEDLAELSALLDVLGPRAHCALGSVSATIGDTRGAAGIAALLKTALAMTAGVIPPATGCVRPHPLLRAEAAPLRLPAVAEPWPDTAVQLAAVNSLGTVPSPGAPRSGPVHVVLRRERDAGYQAGRRRRAVNSSGDAATGPGRAAGAHAAPQEQGTAGA